MERHGLTLGVERVDASVFLSIKAVGTLTHDDYKLIIPILEGALAGVDEPVIDALVDARELCGWAPRAAWDDFKMGLKHGREFRRLALVGNKRWQQLATKVGNWFIAGQARYFDDLPSALAWLTGDEQP
ncbi:STAS/SEC14 domain-containing protein [Gallaecimonas sp. GXIMD1310]|uniref:STAS/SEC14 domain-containing protein n=1 Tax=Gallaecimonas sp. GXIMD1310 TaxID=3131926 RepID=UPI00324B64B4